MTPRFLNLIATVLTLSLGACSVSPLAPFEFNASLHSAPQPAPSGSEAPKPVETTNKGTSATLIQESAQPQHVPSTTPLIPERFLPPAPATVTIVNRPQVETHIHNDNINSQQTQTGPTRPVIVKEKPDPEFDGSLVTQPAQPRTPVATILPEPQFIPEPVEVESGPFPVTADFLAVNASPTPFSLVKNEMIRWQFSVVRGRTYKIQTNVPSGAVALYVAKLQAVDPDIYDYRDSYGGPLEFKAEETGILYLALKDKGYDNTGSHGTVRLISAEETLVSATGSLSPLLANCEPTDFSLVRNEIQRWQLSVVRGRTYKIQTNVPSGAVALYVAKLQAVDPDIYDYRDSYGGPLEFKAESSGTLYLAIKDKGYYTTGSKGTVRLLSSEEPTSPASVASTSSPVESLASVSQTRETRLLFKEDFSTWSLANSATNGWKLNLWGGQVSLDQGNLKVSRSAPGSTELIKSLPAASFQGRKLMVRAQVRGENIIRGESHPWEDAKLVLRYNVPAHSTKIYASAQNTVGTFASTWIYAWQDGSFEGDDTGENLIFYLPPAAYNLELHIGLQEVQGGTVWYESIEILEILDYQG